MSNSIRLSKFRFTFTLHKDVWDITRSTWTCSCVDGILPETEESGSCDVIR